MKLYRNITKIGRKKCI